MLQKQRLKLKVIFNKVGAEFILIKKLWGNDVLFKKCLSENNLYLKEERQGISGKGSNFIRILNKNMCVYEYTIYNIII